MSDHHGGKVFRYILALIMAGIFLFYLIRAMNTFNRIMDKIEKDIEKIGDTTKEMIEDLKGSFIFNFLFRKKRRTRKE